MEKVLFSSNAIGSILVECYKNGRKLETGGILIGPESHKNVITDVVVSSIHADRESSFYYQNERDVKFLNKELRKFQLKGYEHKGNFHSHPTGMFNLSQGDIDTSLNMLRSPSYKLNNNLIMCIVTESNQNVDMPIFSYIVSQDDNNDPVVKQVASKMLPRHCIIECLECI
ncbi:MAG: hypothetical protein HON76_08490 [Candidatus Scalindua sp.]|jgi:hypothetical protein|nr:hypothetical protein [Candidatus Scalindua sp.]